MATGGKLTLEQLKQIAVKLEGHLEKQDIILDIYQFNLEYNECYIKCFFGEHYDKLLFEQEFEIENVGSIYLNVSGGHAYI